ncbi:hypothetical protein ACFWIA_23030 [Streptomyces sp. NPDC127068]|uniref:hypothetical protein n=1 Tax=Streptomyces sp. NPDC127068 TaxID=3347127 RepID=UPI003650BCF4
MRGRLTSLAVVAAGALTAVVALSGTGHAASDGGDLNNETQWKMHLTYGLGSGSDRCDVWNYSGGPFENWKYAPCTQRSLGGKKRSDTTKDTDAFTFNDRDYLVRVAGGDTRWATKGVWTKLWDNQDAKCVVDPMWGVPYCTVYWS